MRDRAPLLAPIARYKRSTISIRLTKIMSKTIHINCYFNFFSHLNNISSLFYLISISFATSISSTLTNNQCPVPRPMHATHFYNFYTYNNYYYHQYEDLVYMHAICFIVADTKLRICLNACCLQYFEKSASSDMLISNEF